MFFDDPHAAFANLFHWLAPGGRFVFAVWGPVAENPWMTTIRDVVGAILDIPKPDPEAPGPFRYGDASKLINLLGASGFDSFAVDDWRGALNVGGGLPAPEAADFAIASFSSFSEMLAAAGEETLQRARKSLTERFSEHLHDGVVQMGASVHIVTGSRAKK